MPRHPALSATNETLSSRVFSGLAQKAAAMRADGLTVHALSVGDTYPEPLPVARAENQHTEMFPELHKYAPPTGEPALLDAIAERLALFDQEVPVERIQVVSGATSGLSVVASTLFDPGDEVLLPAPFWPLIRGIIASRGAVPVQVPLFDRLGGLDVEAVLEAAVTPRTCAIYINTPHNPTGVILPTVAIDAMVRVAERHDLWVVTDEAYQDLWFGAEAPEPVWARADLAERYVACHTLSKSYGIAGSRIGYVHGGDEVMRAIRAVQTFQTYCAPKPMQMGAARVLREGAEWLKSRREEYALAGAKTAEVLGQSAPAGGTFLLFDATPYFHAGETDSLGFLDRCLDAGVLMTPGVACGTDYGSWARICFTSVPPDELDDALARISGVIES